MIALNKNPELINIAEKCNTDDQKVEFFDQNHLAFFSESISEKIFFKDNIPKIIDDAFYVYANMKRMSEKELEALKKLPYIDYPRNFKIFLFDFCI